MRSVPERGSQFRLIFGIVGVGAIVAAVALVGLGVIRYISPDGAEAWSAVWMIVAGMSLLFFSIALLSLMPAVLRIEERLARQVTALSDLRETTAQQSEALQLIVENTRLSDAARSLAHRGPELDALRTAIREDLRATKWEAASSLIDEMERRFGQKDEADRLREELDDARSETIESKLAEAIAMVESHFQSFDWTRAQSELDRLRNALPDNVKIDAMQARMKILKDKHKDGLMQDWDEAVRRCDTDHAIDILKEIDQYLSPAEAEALQVSARDVFKEKLLQLGVQFRFAVTERRWQDALSVGLELVRDFPNSRMANEVREALDTLRARARSTTDSEDALREVAN